MRKLPVQDRVTMIYFKLLLLSALLISISLARSGDWKDIFPLYSFFEKDGYLPSEQIYTSNWHKDLFIPRTDSMPKRQDIDAFQRGKLGLKTCASCCCTALYRPRKIVLGPDIYVIVMEVSSCTSTCPGIQMCTKVASDIEWNKMGSPVNNTAIFTSCACIP